MYVEDHENRPVEPTEALKKHREKLVQLYHVADFGKDFNALTSNADRIRFAHGLMQKGNLLPSANPNDCIKNEQKSTGARMKGNYEFRQDNSIIALQKYNKALCFAPPGSACMSLAYGNRSAVYLKAGFYKFCMENIDLALEIPSYPQNLRQKLLDRKEECVKLMAHNIDSFDLYSEPPQVKLSGPANPKIPFMIKDLKMERNAKYGRHIVATKNLNSTDVILIESPFLKVNNETDTMYNHCYNCSRNNFLNLRPCPRSNLVMFCSKKCEDEAWDEFYKYEYPIVGVLHEYFDKQNYAIIVRMILKAVHLFKDMKNLKEFVATIDTNVETPLDIDYRTATDREKFRAMWTLQALTTNTKSEQFLVKSGICAIISHLLRQYTTLGDLIKNRDDEDIFLDTLMHLLQIQDINSMTYDDPFYLRNCTCNGVSHFYIGISLPLVQSLFNFSCAANTAQVVTPEATYLIVLRPIKAGEEVFVQADRITYLDLTRLERQQRIRDRFNYDCECEACITNFPMFPDGPKTPKVTIPTHLIYELSEISQESKYPRGSLKKAKKALQLVAKTMPKYSKNYPSWDVIFMELLISKCITVLALQKPLEWKLAPKQAN